MSKTSGQEGLNDLRSIRAVQLMDRNGIPGPEADNKAVTGQTHSTHRGFDEVHQRCYEEKCCKPMAQKITEVLESLHKVVFSGCESFRIF